MKRARRNIEKQEEVVSTLWDFADDLQHRQEYGHVATLPRTNTKVSLEHIGRAMKRIMTAFGYEVTEVQ